MGKTAFIFPGQGSQYIGMGKDFYEKYNSSHKVYEMASDITGLDICKLCFEDNSDINTTEYTQICMLTTETAIMEALKDEGIVPDITAGLSLGEYASVTASGAISMEDVFKLIRQRGIYMQKAYPVGGGMTAIIGLSAAEIENIISSIDDVVSIANYNCPGQIIITGKKYAVDKAAEKCKEQGAKKAIPLNVSGPFHSNLLAKASTELAKDLENITLDEIKIPYISNVTADYAVSSEIKSLLAQQITSPIKWQQSIEKMIADGVDDFLEVGPGKTLSGFLKKINKSVSIRNIDTIEKL